MLPKTWRWVLGMIYVVAVAVIWIVASFVVQSVVDSGVSPFLITYVCNTLFLVYIPIIELGNVAKSLLGRMRSKRSDGDTLPQGLSISTEKSSETDNLIEAGNRSDQGSQAVAVSNDKASYAVPDVPASEDACETSVMVEGDSMLKPSSSRKVWTRKEVALASLIVCPFWFLAQYTFNLSLKYTTVTSNTILSSTSSLFTFFMSLRFLKEKFAWVKLLSVLLCMAGTIVVSLSDSVGSTSVAKNQVWGDLLCLVSACFYAVYTTLIKKKLPDEVQGEEEASTALFFGYLGLFNGLLLLPVMLLLHFTGVEPLHRLSALQYGLIIAKGMFDNVLSDYLWAKAVLLTSTTAATAGLTIQVPIAAVVDTVRGIKLGILEYIGGVCILVGFLGINEVATGCCSTSNEVDDHISTNEVDDHITKTPSGAVGDSA
eukprot:c23212_g1_i1 orf=583-1869(-)